MGKMVIRKLKREARNAENRKTLAGGNRSGILRNANTKVPAIKPNCTAEVIQEIISGLPRSSPSSGATAFPANQREVPRN